MPLPASADENWPPKDWAPVAADIDEAAVWYGGDAVDLAKLYGKAGAPQTSRLRFWTRRQQDEVTAAPNRLHVPAAADVAATGADLLFGDPPALTIPEAHTKTPDADAVATEARLAELIELDGIHSTLLEAAEIAGGLGGVYLRPVWDSAVANHPMLNIVHADHAVPTFRWGRLVAVTFWSVVETTPAGAVVRHLERHELGTPAVLHGLYVGTKDKLGVRRPADELRNRGVAVDDDGTVPHPEGVEGMLARFVPNVLPNRKHRGVPVGRSDTAGSEDLMDALDETYTSWMRDIRVGKARVVVPAEFLQHTGQRGGGASFDVDREVFTPIEMDPTSKANAGITPVEFRIRTEEHARTAADLFERIVAGAGYSPQSFGLQGDGGMLTATEVDAKEGRSDRTTGKKRRYWEQALADTVFNLLVIDRAVFGSGVTPMRPRIDWPEQQEDPQRVATTLELLNRAQAVSIETRVRMAQPHLDETEVQAEVERIRSDMGLTVDDPTGGVP